MEPSTNVSHAKDASLSTSEAFARDAHSPEDSPFPLSDDELLELAVICLIVDFASRNRASKPEADWWGGV